MGQILDTPETDFQNINPNYSGFWIRVGAYLIDAICLLIVQVVIAFIATGSSGLTGNKNPYITILNLIIGITYFAGMESSSYQGTLGKMACGIKVTDMEGNRISLGKATGRYFSKFISAIILGIGFFMVGFDDKKQGLHDKIAGTFVVSR